MTGESRHRRLEALFLACLDLPPDARDARLRKECGDDDALRDEVIDLLRRDEEEGARDPAALPERIGPYRLFERIGEGGFGEVWAAEQDAPVRRRVAVKILKPGMDSRAVLARFEAERQALARMDHPGIAKVHDAGTTRTGRSYFVMELVNGESITDSCERRGTPLRGRLELFVGVCRAVEHAHQKGVIHRDLKPSNILVTTVDGAVAAKVIDFGIAKATQEGQEGDAARTRPGEILGTPEYMSPEQAASRGADVDTRTDVYSLGVVLYRLATGRLPFEPSALRSAGPAELERILRDDEPPRPSEVAADPAVPPRDVRGDLDWIIGRAMAKDRERRYTSPAALAEDVERHLRWEPVLAGPPTITYRIAKLARRHRAFVAGAAAVGAALVVGLAATTNEALRAARAEAAAQREAGAARAVNDFLERMLEAGNPVTEPRGLDLRVREIVDRAAGELRTAPPAEPDVEAALHHTLGATYSGLGSYDDAERELRQAETLWSREGTHGAELLETRLKLAEVEGLRGRAATAESLLEIAASSPALAAGSSRETRTRYLSLRGGVLGELGRYDEADSCLAEVVERRRPDSGDALGAALQDLAELRRRRGNLDDAERLAREALALARQNHGSDHFGTASACVRLASIRMALGDATEAEALDRTAVETGERVLGPRHPVLAEWLQAHAQTLTILGRLDEAEAELQRALDVQRTVEQEPGVRTAALLGDLADVRQKRGAPEGALPLRLECLSIHRRVQGDHHERVATAWNNLASTYRLLRRLPEADDAFRHALAIFREVHGDDHPNVYVTMINLGKTQLDEGKAAEAERTLRDALAVGARVLPEGHVNRAIGLASYGRALAALGRRDDAIRALREARDGMTATLGTDHARTREVVEELERLGFSGP